METMTPEQVGQWLESHGGPAGGSGPDGNGVITQKAADGSTITTQGQGASMQVVSKQEAAPTTASTAGGSAASGTPAQSGSGVGSVTQQELEARVSRNPNLRYRGQTTKTRTTPADAFGPGKTEQVPVVTWVDATTGQTIEAEVQPGGSSYVITTDAVVPTNKRADAQDGTAKPPEEKNEGGTRYIWQPNVGGPNAGGQWTAVGSAPLTPAEQQAQDAKLPSQSVSKESRGGKDYIVVTLIPKPGQTGTPTIKVIGPDGQEVPGGLPPEPGKDTPTLVTRNGQTYIQHTVTKADGSPGEIYHTDQSGKRVELPQEGKSPYPADLPQFNYDWSAPSGDGGLTAYASAIRARQDLTDAQKATLITDAHGVATSTLGRAQSVISTQENTRANETTQRGQDTAQANQRLSSASTDFGTAVKAAQEGTKYSVGPDAASVLPYYMGLAHLAGQGYGGYNTPPPVGSGPAIQQAGAMGLPGQGLGPAATSAAAANPTGPNVQAASDATRAGSHAAFGALGVPPPPTGAPPPPSGLQSMMMPGGPPPPPPPFQPSGAGAMAMQRAAGGYDPTGVNQILLQAGIDPSIINGMGGVG